MDTIGLLGLLYYYLFLKLNSKQINSNFFISLLLLCVMLTVYILPYKHDRYAYLADILSIIYFFYNPKKIFVPIICLISSYYAYSIYFGIYDNGMLPMSIISGLYFVVILSIGHDVIMKKLPKLDEIKSTSI